MVIRLGWSSFCKEKYKQSRGRRTVSRSEAVTTVTRVPISTVSSKAAALAVTKVGQAVFLLIRIITFLVSMVRLGGIPLSTPRKVICKYAQISNDKTVNCQRHQANLINDCKRALP